MAVTLDDLAALERALAETFPTLAVMPLELVDKGFGSITVKTRDGVIFRIARHARAAAGHAREAALLPALGSRVPSPVPAPLWRIEPGSLDFRHGAIGYRRLPGESLAPHLLPQYDVQTLAAEIAAFLAALHDFPIAEAERLGVPHSDGERPKFENLRAVVMPFLRDVLTIQEYDRLDKWSDYFLADDHIDLFAPALRHGDLWFGNVLIDKGTGQLAGVLDWEAAAIGDPASDISRQLHLGETFFEAVLEAYETFRPTPDHSLRHRAWRRWELLEFAGIQTAMELGDAEELTESIEKLRAGPILASTG